METKPMTISRSSSDSNLQLLDERLNKPRDTQIDQVVDRIREQGALGLGARFRRSSSNSKVEEHGVPKVSFFKDINQTHASDSASDDCFKQMSNSVSSCAAECFKAFISANGTGTPFSYLSPLI